MLLVAPETELCLISERLLFCDANNGMCTVAVGTDRGRSGFFPAQDVDVDRSCPYLFIGMASPARERRTDLVLLVALKIPFGMLIRGEFSMAVNAGKRCVSRCLQLRFINITGDRLAVLEQNGDVLFAVTAEA